MYRSETHAKLFETGYGRHSTSFCFQAAGVPVDFESVFLSEIHPAYSAKLEDVVESVSKNHVCLMGYVSMPEKEGVTGELDSLSMQFRRKLDLFANVVVCESHMGIATRHKNIGGYLFCSV